jgi:anti-anti-sigma factor
MGLDIAQEQQDALRILALRGRLDTDTSADLELAVQDLLAAGARDFLIDLREVSYVSSAGLRVLLALAKQLEGSKGRLRLCALSPAVNQVFEVAGFSKLFAILKDRSAAFGAGGGKPTPPPVSTLAQNVARILRVGAPNPVRSTIAAALAREASQLLGVRQAAVLATPARSVPVVSASAPLAGEEPKSGVLGKLRGVFGKKS